MHELSVTQGILKICQDEQNKAKFKKINEIRIMVGELTGLVPNCIDYYFDMELESRKDIYAFIALAGLFWSNWCEYNYRFGVDFGEYSLLQYRYAKIYARKSLEESENKDESLRI